MPYRNQIVAKRNTRDCHDRRVDVGLHALGIGAGAERTVIDAVAAAAERAGFATLWAGEHIVMVDEAASRYPTPTTAGSRCPPTPIGWTRSLR